MKLSKNFLNLFYKIIKKFKKPMRGSEFVPDSIDLLKRGGSYIDSPKWLKI